MRLLSKPHHFPDNVVLQEQACNKQNKIGTNYIDLSSGFNRCAVFENHRTLCQIRHKDRNSFSLINFWQSNYSKALCMRKLASKTKNMWITAIFVHIGDTLRATATDDHYRRYGQRSKRGKALLMQLLKSKNGLLRRSMCSVLND